MKTRRQMPRFFSRQVFLPFVLLACAAVLSFVALIQPWSLRPSSPVLKEGDVAPQDQRAPRAIVYVSQVKTDEARAAAERAVEPAYAPPDPSVARDQIEQLRAILAYITTIHLDETASMEQKQSSLASLENILLSSQTINFLLLISPARWDAVQNEALNVLEMVMRNPIRSEDLEGVTQNLPSLVSLQLSEQEVGLVVDLVSPLIAINSFYSPELTSAAREAARNETKPVVQSFEQGQTIFTRGQIITAADYEALTVLGLVQPDDQLMQIIGALALVVLSAVITALYYSRSRSPILSDLRSLIMLVLLFLVFLYGARLVIPNRTVAPYIFPLPAFGLLVSVLFGMDISMLLSLVLAMLAAYGLPITFDLVPYYLLSSLCGIMVLGMARRVSHYLWAVVAIAGSGFAVVAAFRLPFSETDLVGVATLAGAAAFNGVAATSLALLLQFILAQFLGSTTALQLIDISRPDFPLLQYFLRRAPGTYQHGLQVANLAEQAAERIGADALLTRVGALYHDVGKAVNPAFFIENQPSGEVDAHDGMAPHVTASVIIRHVSDGLNLAKKHRLPRRIQDFIAEHHGTLITRYQYNRALEEAGGDRTKVNADKFRYPGPTPRSRETALLMLADGVEARTRAEYPQSDDELRAVVRSVIERCQKEGQLERTPLTQFDLAEIVEAFTTTLRGSHHPRLEYPREEVGASAESPTTPIARPRKQTRKRK